MKNEQAQSAQAYLDSLIERIKESGEFEGVVFYRSFDGADAPSLTEEICVCAGVGKTARGKKFLSPYKRHRKQLLEAELELRVSAPSDAGVLSRFCSRLESALWESDPEGITKIEIGAAEYSDRLAAIFRLIKIKAEFFVQQGV